MRILLIFPPQCRPLHPALSLPLIKAELVRRGHECKVFDLNMLFYDHVLKSETLQKMETEISAQLVELEKKTLLTGSDFVRFARISAAKIRSSYVIAHIDKAVQIFRSEAFYDLGNFLWARKVLEEAMELYSCAYGHTDLGISQLRMRYGTSDPAEILAATRDRNENPFIDLLLNWTRTEMDAFAPDAIGISFMLDEQLIPGFTLATELRASWEGLMLAGGSMVTRLRDELPRHPEFAAIFDYYLPFESESQLGDILDEKDFGITSDPVDFTDLLPDFSDLPFDKYLLPDLILPYESARGCSFARCLYCSHYKTYERYRYGDPVKSARHLQTLAEQYDCKHFYFIDEELVPRFGMDLSRELLEREVDISWMVFGRLHKAWNQEVVRQLAAAGCRRLIFGLDGATDRIQKLMHKNTDLVHAGEILKMCARENIALQINFIVGYPGEEEAEARAALDFVEENREALFTLGSCIAMSNFVLVRGAPWDKMKIKPIVDDRKAFANYYAYDTESGLTMQETQRLAHQLQLEADRMLNASWRFPILREFAFLYRDRYAQGEDIPIQTEFPGTRPVTHWYFHDLRAVFDQVDRAREVLPAKPMEHKSSWWRIASETECQVKKEQDLRGYKTSAVFKGNSFELPIRDTFVWSAGVAQGS